MADLSAIGALCGIYPEATAMANLPTAEAERVRMFAKAIHPMNYLEGLTCLTNASGGSSCRFEDWSSFLTRSHVDGGNAWSNGWDYVLTASRCLVDYRGVKSEELPQLK